MRFENYLNESGVIKKVMGALKNKTFKAATKIFKDNWTKLVKIVNDYDKESDKELEAGILKLLNTRYNTNYRSLQQISGLRIMESNEELMNEDLKHFWELVKTEGFPVLAFYPMLQVWLELDKLISITGTGFDMRRMIIYGLFWFFLVSGKFTQVWKKWKKDHPEEFEAEGSKKHAFAR